jgi:hypothetical protein
VQLVSSILDTHNTQYTHTPDFVVVILLLLAAIIRWFFSFLNTIPGFLFCYWTGRVSDFFLSLPVALLLLLEAS